MGALLESCMVGNIGLKHLKVIKEDTLQKWDGLGFLDGLKGHVKENIAQLYENQATHLINEASSASDSGSFETVVFPIIRRVFSKLLANDIVSVQKNVEQVTRYDQDTETFYQTDILYDGQGDPILVPNTEEQIVQSLKDGSGDPCAVYNPTYCWYQNDFDLSGNLVTEIVDVLTDQNVTEIVDVLTEQAKMVTETIGDRAELTGTTPNDLAVNTDFTFQIRAYERGADLATITAEQYNDREFVYTVSANPGCVTPAVYDCP